MNGAVCPNCAGKADPAFVAKDRNQRVSDREFEYRRCRSCALLFLPSIPPDLGDFYAEGYHHLPTHDEVARISEWQGYELRMVERFVKRGRLLEIGPGRGTFASLAATAGYEVHAIERDPECCAHLRSTFGVQTFQSESPSEVLPGLAPYDVVVLWHSLEHLADGWPTLDAAARNLRPGGILLVATPNPSALQFRIFGAAWAHVDAPRHLHLIPLEALDGRLRAAGLAPVMATTRDRGGLRWNLFGWQRTLMAGVRSRFAKRCMWVLGLAVGLVLLPVEATGMRGCTYTVIYQKGRDA